MSVSDFPNWSQVCPANGTRRHRNIDPTFVSENSKWNISLFPYFLIQAYFLIQFSKFLHFLIRNYPCQQLLRRRKTNYFAAVKIDGKEPAPFPDFNI